ncbi:MAG: tellurium resistance TerZ family protein [Deltaproteobacteria bacterium]|jgi:tellurite resistance protein TerA|nr:tellurium resistance TerZ family protein [Deltaproteobacteria bacterium]
MLKLVRGQKTKINLDTDPKQDHTFFIAIKLTWPHPSEVDICCFGLDEFGILSNDSYFVFYNHRTAPLNALKILKLTSTEAIFLCDLQKIPYFLPRLLFTLTVDGYQSFKDLGPSSLIMKNVNGENKLSFNFDGSFFQEERAVLLFEIYKKQVWRCGAICQGYNHMGLKELLEYFGGTISEHPEVASEDVPDLPVPRIPKDLEEDLDSLILEGKGKGPAVASMAPKPAPKAEELPPPPKEIYLPPFWDK